MQQTLHSSVQFSLFMYNFKYKYINKKDAYGKILRKDIEAIINKEYTH